LRGALTDARGQAPGGASRHDKRAGRTQGEQAGRRW
jgi:hypothetical protein